LNDTKIDTLATYSIVLTSDEFINSKHSYDVCHVENCLRSSYAFLVAATFQIKFGDSFLDEVKIALRSDVLSVALENASFSVCCTSFYLEG